MEGREFVFALLGVIFVTMAFNAFYVDIGVSNDIAPQSGLDMQWFNKTQEVLGTVEGMKNETTFLEDVWIIGDIAAIVGSAAKGMKLLYEIPGIFMNMINQVGDYIGIPGWVFTIVGAFILVLVVFIVLSYFRGFRT